jgi:hypothetical protein
MKITKLLLCATVAGAMAFAASKVSAFPLKLSAITGTISATPNYSPLYSTNKAQYITAAVTLKDVLLVVSNTVTINNHNNSITNPVPKDAYIAWDPVYGSDYGYLTNSSGYFQSLSGICYFDVEDIATSFNGNVSGNFTESDKIVFYADIYGYGPDGLYYEFYNDYGTGVLTYAVTQNGTKGTMTVYSEGGGYGALEDSDDGESNGKLLFTGTGTTQFSGPYSLWWWD